MGRKNKKATCNSNYGTVRNAEERKMSNPSQKNLAQVLQDKNTWWVHFLIVAAIWLLLGRRSGTRT
jgi:hypothetical protein